MIRSDHLANQFDRVIKKNRLEWMFFFFTIHKTICSDCFANHFDWFIKNNWLDLMILLWFTKMNNSLANHKTTVQSTLWSNLTSSLKRIKEWTILLKITKRFVQTTLQIDSTINKCKIAKLFAIGCFANWFDQFIKKRRFTKQPFTLWNELSNS